MFSFNKICNFLGDIMFNRVVYADKFYVNNYVNNENLVEILENLVRVNDDMIIPTPVTFKAPVSIFQIKIYALIKSYKRENTIVESVLKFLSF